MLTIHNGSIYQLIIPVLEDIPPAHKQTLIRIAKILLPQFLTNQLTFNKSFGKHHVNAVVVAEQQTFNFSQITGQGNNTQSNDIKEPQALANQSFNGDRQESALISYVARVNYDFGDKYFLGASIRRDGSSRFHPDTRWGTFPASVAAGWRLSEESVP